MSDGVQQLHKPKLSVVPYTTGIPQTDGKSGTEKWSWKASLAFMIAGSGAAWLGFLVIVFS